MPFRIGQTASRSKTITESDVFAFAKLSGDRNPLHLDAEYAQTTRFGARIAHGAYLGQTVRFLKPVYCGDTITATVEITAIRPDQGILTLKTDCFNQRGEKVAAGEATALHEDAKCGPAGT